MRVCLSLSFIFISIFVLSAQSDEYTIELLPTGEKIGATFYCDSIIDNRTIRSNIGTFRIGLPKRNIPVSLENPFQVTLKKYINEDLLFSLDGGEGLIFIIDEFTISEHTNVASKSAICKMKLKFAKMQGAELYSFGSYYAEAKESVLNYPEQYSSLIRSCLLNCLQAFGKDGFTDQEPYLIQLSESDPFNFNALPEIAYYASFYDLRDDRAMDYFKTQIYVVNDQVIEHFKVKANERKNRKKDMAYLKHNDQLYINASTYSGNDYFVKAKQIGRFIYFEDRYTTHPSATFLVFGAVGFGASLTTKSLVIDTNTGIVEVVNPETIDHYINNYPDLRSYWSSSPKKRKNIEEIFIRLNQKEW